MTHRSPALERTIMMFAGPNSYQDAAVRDVRRFHHEVQSWKGYQDLIWRLLVGGPKCMFGANENRVVVN